MRIVLRSKLGLGLAAIRDSDRTAASFGIDIFSSKLYAFLIAASVIGAAGAIFLNTNRESDPALPFISDRKPGVTLQQRLHLQGILILISIVKERMLILRVSRKSFP